MPKPVCTGPPPFAHPGGTFSKMWGVRRRKQDYGAGVFSEWPLGGSPWSVFVDGRYDYDEFKSWLHRVNGHAGLGYQLINNDTFKLKLRGGAGASKEWGSDNDHIVP